MQLEAPAGQVSLTLRYGFDRWDWVARIAAGAGLLFVHGQQALVKMGLGLERGLVSQQDVEERQVWNVASQNHYAYGERSG